MNSSSNNFVSNLLNSIKKDDFARKIIFIIGDGIMPKPYIKRPSRIIREEKSSNPDYVKSDETDYCICWNDYESNKVFTYFMIPDISYFLLVKLCNAGLVRGIITTNYDLIFESVYKNAPSLNISSIMRYNSPIKVSYIYGNEYDENEFNSASVLNEYRSSVFDYFKIHGTFETYVSTKNKDLLFSLERYKHYTINSYLDLNIINTDNNKHIFPLEFTNIEGLNISYDDLYFHYIDMFNTERNWFEDDITFARSFLNDNESDILINLGFTGRFYKNEPNPPNSEEIVPDILKHIEKGGDFYCILSQSNDWQNSGLLQKLETKYNTVYNNNVIVNKVVSIPLMKLIVDLGIGERDDLEFEYDNTWIRNGMINEFFVEDKELAEKIKFGVFSI